MKHEIPFGTFQPGKRAYLFRFSTFSGNFFVDEPTKSCPFTAEPKFPQILTKRKVPFILARGHCSSKSISFLVYELHILSVSTFLYIRASF